MKRTTIVVSIFVSLLSLALVSCDQMFSNNLFAGLTQKKVDAASVAQMSPMDIAGLTDSKDSMAQLAADAAAKQEALAKLAAAYGTTPATSNTQTEAIAAGDISIQTVPDAAQFAAKAISLVSTLSSTSQTSLASALAGILPADISGQLSSPTPPQAFTDMIAAFTDAYGAYTALSAGVSSAGYVDPSVTSSQKTEIAVNAAISGMLSTITPTTGTLATALWSAIANPSNASAYITLNTSGVVDSGGTVYGLIQAAGITL